MKRVTTLAVFLCIIFAGQSAWAEPQIPFPERINEVIYELVAFLKDKGVKATSGESMEDVAMFGYLYAIKGLGAPLGHLDDSVKKEAIAWLSYWCWLPGTPERNKGEGSQEAAKVRKIFSQGLYKRTMAQLTVVPSFSAFSILEVTTPDNLFEFYTPFGKSREVYKLFRSERVTFEEYRSLNFKYTDIVNTDWVNKYLR